MWYYTAGKDGGAQKITAPTGEKLLHGKMPALPKEALWHLNAVFLFYAHPRLKNRRAVLLESIGAQIISRGSCPRPEDVRPLSQLFFLNLAERLLTRAHQEGGDREGLARLIRTAVLQTDAVQRTRICRRLVEFERPNWQQGVNVTHTVASYIREAPEGHCRSPSFRRWHFVRNLPLP